MSKRPKPSIFDDYFTRPGRHLWTCRNCNKFSKESDTGKDGTGSLKSHLKTSHPKEFKEYEAKSKKKQNQLPIKIPKLEEKPTSRQIPREQSPGAYWKSNESRFPYLTTIFKRFGTAPATSAEVERLFSLAGNIVTDLRKRLSNESLEKLLFLNANLPLLKN